MHGDVTGALGRPLTSWRSGRRSARRVETVAVVVAIALLPAGWTERVLRPRGGWATNTALPPRVRSATAIRVAFLMRRPRTPLGLPVAYGVLLSLRGGLCVGVVGGVRMAGSQRDAEAQTGAGAGSATRRCRARRRTAYWRGLPWVAVRAMPALRPPRRAFEVHPGSCTPRRMVVRMQGGLSSSRGERHLMRWLGRREKVAFSSTGSQVPFSRRRSPRSRFPPACHGRHAGLRPSELTSTGKRCHGLHMCPRKAVGPRPVGLDGLNGAVVRILTWAARSGACPGSSASPLPEPVRLPTAGESLTGEPLASSASSSSQEPSSSPAPRRLPASRHPTPLRPAPRGVTRPHLTGTPAAAVRMPEPMSSNTSAAIHRLR